MIEAALATDNLEVVAAFNPKQAQRILAERSTPPLLALVDVLMPGGTNGLDLARSLQDRLPPNRLILMSGHLSFASWWPEDLRDVAFIAKPFRLQELLDLVTEARGGLDGAG